MRQHSVQSEAGRLGSETKKEKHAGFKMSGNSRKKVRSTCMHKERSRQFEGNQTDCLSARQAGHIRPMRQVIQDRSDEAGSGMIAMREVYQDIYRMSTKHIVSETAVRKAQH
jgi:hypothetical protein